MLATKSRSTMTDFCTPRRFMIISIVSSSFSRTFCMAKANMKGKISNAIAMIGLSESLLKFLYSPVSIGVYMMLKVSCRFSSPLTFSRMDLVESAMTCNMSVEL